QAGADDGGFGAAVGGDGRAVDVLGRRRGVEVLVAEQAHSILRSSPSNTTVRHMPNNREGMRGSMRSAMSSGPRFEVKIVVRSSSQRVLIRSLTTSAFQEVMCAAPRSSKTRRSALKNRSVPA